MCLSVSVSQSTILAAFFLAAVGSAQSLGLDESRNALNDAAAQRDRTRYAQFLRDDVTSVDRSGWLRDKAAAVEDLPGSGS